MAKNKELKGLIEIELTNLDRLVEELKGLLSKKENKRTSYDVRAAGSILHDFYCGVEKIFERIALSIDKNIPQGENWHTELLLQMGKRIDGIRDKLIPDGLLVKLKEFLRFRHLFRHIYGFELKWGRIEPLCSQLEQVSIDLKKEIDERFLKANEG